MLLPPAPLENRTCTAPGCTNSNASMSMVLLIAQLENRASPTKTNVVGLNSSPSVHKAAVSPKLKPAQFDTMLASAGVGAEKAHAASPRTAADRRSAGSG